MRSAPAAAAVLALVAAALAALLAAMMAAPASVKPPRLAVIGRGCDPVRARFAEKQWAPRLGVDMDSATSDEELFGKLAKRRFDLFFMAPGACQRTQMGVYAGNDVVQRVKEMQPHIKVVMMDRGVEHGLSDIASALGLPPVTDVARNTADWPFAD